MNDSRFWTGLVFLGGLPMSLVLGVVKDSAPIESTLEGRVQCNGRPTTCGVLYFYSQDQERGYDVIAAIRPDGTFSCRPVWPEEDGARVCFRVHFYPGLGATGPGAMPPAPAPVLASAAPKSADERIEQLLQASQGVPGPAAAYMAPSAPTTTLTSHLYHSFDVRLGPEPTYLEIDLKD